MGKLANETDGVGEQVVAPAGAHHAGGGVKGVKQAVTNGTWLP